jgi:hypothetical protein
MSYQIDVDFPGLVSSMERIPAMRFTLQLDTQSMDQAMYGMRRYIWRLLHPIPPQIRLLLGDKPMGTWTQNSVGFSFYPQSDRGTLLMELRQVGNNSPNGPAFALPRSNNSYGLKGTWSASAKPLPKTWVGIMGKGSVGLGLGAEGGVGAVVSLDSGCRNGAVFSFGSGRVIIGGGFSGGLALVIATGFDSARKFDNFWTDGKDWALSVGTNFKGLAAGGKLSRINPVLASLAAVGQTTDRLQALATAKATTETAGVWRKMVSSETFGKEIYGVMKGITSGALINTDTQTVTAIDIPLASAGTEAGLYYSMSQFNLLASW